MCHLKFRTREKGMALTYKFKCAATHCKHSSGRIVRRYLDKSDKKSTSNLRRHARNCWGDEIVKNADACGSVNLARGALKNVTLKDGSLTAVFERTGKGKISYSHRQHTRIETRYVSSMLNLGLSHSILQRRNCQVGRSEHATIFHRRR